MPQFFTIFLICVFSLTGIVLGLGKIATGGEKVDIDSQYLDEDGDHVYYERSLIKKKVFRRRNPHITNLRSFSRLLRNL